MEINIESLLNIIEKEDKKNPMTDEHIATELSTRREIITQFRLKNNIPDSRERGKGLLTKEAKEILGKDKSISEREFTRLLNNRGYMLSRRVAAELKKELLPIINHQFQKEIDKSANKDSKQEESFSCMIGSQNSLKLQISQAKAAVLYPPYGLHTLILGSSGVGKSQMAEEMYNFSINYGILPKSAPFIIFNCADYSDNPQLLLSQLFGYIKGAFTGAGASKPGLVEKANGGILFLDEVHRLPKEGQEILFLLLDKGQFRRLGESDNIRTVKFMLIAATTENPESSLLLTFRRRIPMVIELPSLRERPYSERYEIIKDFFVKESFRIGRTIIVESDSIAALMLYDCPGNIGQLRSDIQVACARGFLSSMSKDKKDILINLIDLPKNASIYYNKDNNKMLKIQEYLNYSLVANPDNTFITYRQGDRYILPDKIYQFIEEEYKSLNEKGLDRKEIDEEVGKKIDKELKKFVKNSKTIKVASKNELIEIIGEDIVKSTDLALEIAKSKGLNLQTTFYYSLAIHLSAAYNRIKSGKIIFNPQLKKIKKEMSKEYEIANIMVDSINSYLKIKLPDDEIGFITMYLNNFSENKILNKKSIGIIVLSHGYVASAMVDVANRLMGVNHAVVIEMSLDENPSSVYERVLNTAIDLDEGKGVLILADMGSLLSFGEKITEETGIITRTIERVDTIMVIEAVRRVILPDSDIDEIARILNKSQVDTNLRLIDKTKEELPNAIITICITGEGAALTAKKYVEESINDLNNSIKIIPLSMIKHKNIENTIVKIGNRYNILAIIGTINPSISNIPFVPLAQIVKGDGSDILKKLLIRQNDDLDVLPEIINKELILFNSILTNKEDVIDKLSSLLLEGGYIDENYLLSVYKRELNSSTLFEGKIALPHGEPEGVKRPAIAIAKMAKPILWDNNEYTDLVFLFAFNENSRKYFSDIYNLFTDDTKLESLRQAKNINKFLEIFMKNKKFH